MYVVMISTAGNQRYIFSSGKRQEIAGASDLIARVDGTWAEQALEKVFPGFAREVWRIGGHDAELLVAGAGGITMLVGERGAGRRLVTELTRRALEDAPGLDVCGVVVEHAGGSLDTVIREARTELAAVRESRPGPQARFPRLPPIEDCATSGLPAAGTYREAEGEPVRPRSAVALAKLNAYPDALRRLAEDAGTDRSTMRGIVDRLGLEAEWVAVVHADGNGLGELFRSLGDQVAAGDDRGYADVLRNFSLGVDGCARKAFREALRRTAAEPGMKTYGGLPPVLPLVLGGDDLTVVCEGTVALPFTRHYLEAFEQETAREPLLRPALANAGRARLDAAAGVAIVKRNYPFHFAYSLAEQLIEAEAKQVKEWGSALAFTVLFESSAPDLARIRRSVPLSGGSADTASPYLVGEGAGDVRVRGRRWEDLVRRAAALERRDPRSGEPLIPRSAVHDLREGLCVGEEVAASRFELLRHRFGGDPEREAALMDLTEEQDGLLWRDRDGRWGNREANDDARINRDMGDGSRERRGRVLTGLFDAVAALPFLPVREGGR